jgi:hypothetical protein
MRPFARLAGASQRILLQKRTQGQRECFTVVLHVCDTAIGQNAKERRVQVITQSCAMEQNMLARLGSECDFSCQKHRYAVGGESGDQEGPTTTQ